MRNIAAYLLAVLGGNSKPDAAAITKILQAVSIERDKEKIAKLIAELNGKDINEVIAQGSAKLSAVPSGGGGGGGGEGATAAPTGGAAPAKDEGKGGKGKGAPKEEKKKEEPKEEEEDADMGFGLFD